MSIKLGSWQESLLLTALPAGTNNTDASNRVLLIGGVGINCLVALEGEAWRNELWMVDQPRLISRNLCIGTWAYRSTARTTDTAFSNHARLTQNRQTTSHELRWMIEKTRISKTRGLVPVLLQGIMVLTFMKNTQNSYQN